MWPAPGGRRFLWAATRPGTQSGPDALAGVRDDSFLRRKSRSLTKTRSAFGAIEDASALRGVKVAIGAKKASLIYFARPVSVSSSVLISSAWAHRRFHATQWFHFTPPFARLTVPEVLDFGGVILFAAGLAPAVDLIVHAFEANAVAPCEIWLTLTNEGFQMIVYPRWFAANNLCGF